MTKYLTAPISLKARRAPRVAHSHSRSRSASPSPSRFSTCRAQSVRRHRLSSRVSSKTMAIGEQPINNRRTRLSEAAEPDLEDTLEALELEALEWDDDSDEEEVVHVDSIPAFGAWSP